jgi:hypothetical protein
LEKKAGTWSDDVSSKAVFLSRVVSLRLDIAAIQGADTPIHTPIIEGAVDTPIDTPTDTIDHTDTDTETETETKRGGGVSDLTDREALLVAMGHDASGVTATGRMVGNQGDMMVFNQWTGSLGLTLEEVIATIAEVRHSQSYPKPGPFSFKFFNSPMQRLAGQKAEGALQPTQGGSNGSRDQNQARNTTRGQSGGIADRATRLRGASLVPDDPA